jgi:hypothetical protein
MAARVAIKEKSQDEPGVFGCIQWEHQKNSRLGPLVLKSHLSLHRAPSAFNSSLKTRYTSPTAAFNLLTSGLI